MIDEEKLTSVLRQIDAQRDLKTEDVEVDLTDADIHALISEVLGARAAALEFELQRNALESERISAINALAEHNERNAGADDYRRLYEEQMRINKATAEEYNAELSKMIALVDDLRAQLEQAGATVAEQARERDNFAQTIKTFLKL